MWNNYIPENCRRLHCNSALSGTQLQEFPKPTGCTQDTNPAGNTARKNKFEYINWHGKYTSYSLGLDNWDVPEKWSLRTAGSCALHHCDKGTILKNISNSLFNRSCKTINYSSCGGKRSAHCSSSYQCALSDEYFMDSATFSHYKSKITLLGREQQQKELG